jgi:surface antigen
MIRQQQAWQFLRQHRLASILVGHVVVMIILASTWAVGAFGGNLLGAFAQTPCAAGDQAHVVVSGDTLGLIAMNTGTTWQRLRDYNKLANPNLIYVNQHICIPGNGAPGNAPAQPPPNQNAVHGTGNYFPYGQCTWWGNQRYFELHGIYVPWTTQSDAWQWSDRARDFGWTISSTPTVGSILNLQPWVQDTWGLGHVAIVEEVLPDGRVRTSNMNWASQFLGQVNSVIFSPGPGVTFISS